MPKDCSCFSRERFRLTAWTRRNISAEHIVYSRYQRGNRRSISTRQAMEDISDLSVVHMDDIKRAQDLLKIAGVCSTPLIPLNYHVPNKQIYIKLENLQPVRSFKIRGACSALGQLPADCLRDGVYTSSAGNFAQGLAWMARKLDVPCKVIVPDTVPLVKTQAIERLGAQVLKVEHREWWQVMMSGHYEGMAGRYIHPVCNKNVIAGNGTIGLEIVDQVPDVDTVICPWGGGGNCAGIASALRQIQPNVKVMACEVDTGAPLAASRKAGKPVTLTNHRASFVDGMNGKSLFPQMWRLAENLVADSVVLTETQIAEAVRLLVERNCVVAEGAGAAPVAAALTDHVPDGNIVCVISGGNIDTKVLINILQGNVPE